MWDPIYPSSYLQSNEVCFRDAFVNLEKDEQYEYLMAVSHRQKEEYEVRIEELVAEQEKAQVRILFWNTVNFTIASSAIETCFVFLIPKHTEAEY